MLENRVIEQKLCDLAAVFDVHMKAKRYAQAKRCYDNARLVAVFNGLEEEKKDLLFGIWGTRGEIIKEGLFKEELVQKAVGIEDEEERKALVRMLAVQMKKSLSNWNKDGMEDQKVVDDLREYSGGAIDLTLEDLHLSEPQSRYYNNNNNQRRQNNYQRNKQNFQRRKQQH